MKAKEETMNEYIAKKSYLNTVRVYNQIELYGIVPENKKYQQQT